MRKILETWEFYEGLAKVKIEVEPYYFSVDGNLILPWDNSNNKLNSRKFYQVATDYSDMEEHFVFDDYDEYDNWYGYYSYIMYNYIDRWWKILSKHNFTKASNFLNTEATVELFGKSFIIDNNWNFTLNEDTKNKGISKIFISTNSYEWWYYNYINSEWKILNDVWWDSYYSHEWKYCQYGGIVEFCNWGYNFVDRTWKLYSKDWYKEAYILSWWTKVKLKSKYDSVVLNTKTWKELKWIFKYL